MSTIDTELIRRKLEELKDNSVKLDEFVDMDKNKFLSDHHYYGLAEHYLQLSIENVLDIARHLVVALELRTPEDSHGLLPLVAKAGVVSNEFVQNNQGMVGFRNVLVHAYAEVDHEKVYENLQVHAGVFEEFTKQVSTYLLLARGEK